jgi:hypothetical protein
LYLFAQAKGCTALFACTPAARLPSRLGKLFPGPDPDGLMAWTIVSLARKSVQKRSDVGIIYRSVRLMIENGPNVRLYIAIHTPTHIVSFAPYFDVRFSSRMSTCSISQQLRRRVL